MFGDLDWPLNASRGLSAIAEFLVYSCYHAAWYWLVHGLSVVYAVCSCLPESGMCCRPKVHWYIGSFWDLSWDATLRPEVNVTKSTKLMHRVCRNWQKDHPAVFILDELPYDNVLLSLTSPFVTLFLVSFTLPICHTLSCSVIHNYVTLNQHPEKKSNHTGNTLLLSMLRNHDNRNWALK